MSAPPGGAKTPRDRPSGRRRVAYTIIALLLPALLFGLLELALHLAGFGAYPPLFVPAAGAAGYLQPNEAAMTRFFAQPSRAPGVSIDTTYFARHKDPASLRIFVQGGSSAAGFPYGKWASPAGMLKRRLRSSYPERDIEVISTAMSAINSYALLDFADEIIAEQPDAVLIYAGHNEYLGVLGVGSAYSSSRSIALTRVIMRLRRLRSYRLLERALTRAPPARSGTLMARIAGERRIPFHSDLYAQGIAQYRANMDALLARYRAAGVPVFVGTLASNERDQPPFIGEAGADARYAEGQALLRAGDAMAARAALRQARDYDELRFRAPSEFNDVLRSVADRHGARMVDVEAAFAAASPDGIIGKETLLEHLHPNERGYFLLADAFFDSLLAHGVVDDPDRAIDEARAWRERPVTRIDALAAGYRLDVLLADWPFRANKQPVSLPPAVQAEEQIAQAWYLGRIGWPEAMNRALVYYQQQNDLDNAVRVALNLAEAFHFLGNVQYIAGQLLTRQGNPALANSYLQRAVQLEPRPDYLLALGRSYLATGAAAKARSTLQQLLRYEPDNTTARELLDAID